MTMRRLVALLREADRTALFGLSVALLLFVLAVFAPLIAPHDPAQQSISDRLMPPFWLDGGSLEFVLGTDNLGRDVLSRVIWSTRTSVGVSASVVLVAGIWGTTLGLIAGYKGGRVDTIVMRVIDTQAAFPGLLLILLILAVVGPSIATLVIVLSVTGWMMYSRVTRGAVLSLKEASFVEAAELVGCRPRTVMFRHILPNLSSTLLTLAVLEFARVILSEASLSFLGLGIQPPEVSWGLDIATGRNYMFSAWWLVTFPGIAIAVTVLGLNLLAGWIRIVADPQEREKRFAKNISEISTQT